MGYTTLTDHRAMAITPIIANRPVFKGKRPMTPENLATLKRLQASDRRSVASQCSVHFIAGCDCGAATLDRTPPAPVKPARKAPVRKATVRKATAARKAHVRPATAGQAAVTVRYVEPVKRDLDFRTRQYAFSDGPSARDLKGGSGHRSLDSVRGAH